MEHHVSAGVILYIPKEEPVFLLLHYEEGHWDFPKGHIEPGESHKEAAIRECDEETRITDLAFVEGFEEKVHYSYRYKNKKITKDVFFFLATTNTELVKLSYEHIGHAWLSYDKALEQLTYENARKVLRKAKEFVDNTK